MKTTLWKSAGLTGLILFSSQLSPAAEDTAAVLQRQTQEMVDAIATGSVAVWDRYLDPRAVVTAEDGAVYTKAQMLEQTKPLPAGVSGTIKVIDFKATDHGPVAIATYISDEDETYHGHKLHCQYRTTDTWVKTPAGWRLIASQVLALRTDPPAVPFTKKQIEEYSGRYALTPEITYEIRAKDGGLEGQQTGRQPEVLKAEAPDVLFVPGKVRYRKVFQRDANGRVTGFAERREAWDLEWKRLQLTTAASVAGPEVAPKSAILAVVRTLTDGWREADAQKVESALHPDFRLVTLRRSPKGPETQIDTRAHLLETVSKIQPGTWDDRLSEEEVRVDPTGIATVWARYRFYIAGNLHHCGIESFQLYQTADGWKIVNFADTHDESYCGARESGKP